MSLSIVKAAAILSVIPWLVTDAQTTSIASTVAVTIVLVDSVRNTTNVASVSRSANRPGVNIVQIKRSALSPELLSVALQACTKSVKRHGREPAGNIAFSFAAGLHHAPLSQERRNQMEALMDQLVNANARTIKGIGHYRAITTDIPDTP